MQEIATFLLVALAAAWLGARWLRRRGAGTCCGERECPAAKDMLKRLRRGGA